MIETGAAFSPDRRYRWSLYRRWAEGGSVLFICLNASTADETKDDPTVRRCVNFARDWGYGAMSVGNLFGLRSMDPNLLYTTFDPIGLENDYRLSVMAKDADRIVLAWGNHGKCRGRAEQVTAMLKAPALFWALRDRSVIWPAKPLYCFGVNKSGEPVHPLYQRRDTRLVRYVR